MHAKKGAVYKGPMAPYDTDQVARRCVAYRCTDDALPDGQLCRPHQRRLDRGGGLPVFGERVKGDPSGYGLYGILDENALGILCHECGQRFAGLGHHVRRSHDLSSKEHQQRHGVRPRAAAPRDDGRVRRRPHPCWRCNTPVTTHGKLCDDCKAQRERELAARQAQTVSMGLRAGAAVAGSPALSVTDL